MEAFAAEEKAGAMAKLTVLKAAVQYLVAQFSFELKSFSIRE